MNRTAAQHTDAGAKAYTRREKGTAETVETRKISGIVGTRGTMKIKTAAGLRFFTVLLAFLLLFTGAAAAADEPTTKISPVVLLTFNNVPDGILTGGEIGVDAAAKITEELVNLTKTQQEKADITNIAYAVALTPKGFEKTDITKVLVTLPTTTTWVEEQPFIYIVEVEGETTSIHTPTVAGTEKDPAYQTELIGLPDMVLLIGAQNDINAKETPTETETTPTPTANQTATETPATTPAPLLGLFAGLAVALLIKARGG